jgi:hypothetical protein
MVLFRFHELLYVQSVTLQRMVDSQSTHYPPGKLMLEGKKISKPKNEEVVEVQDIKIINYL